MSIYVVNVHIYIMYDYRDSGNEWGIGNLNNYTLIYFINLGDFHFLWECLTVLFIILWGISAQPGSPCNLGEVTSRQIC